MPAIEVKFLFDGVIFSSPVFISRISNSLNKYELSINFLSNYLVSRYSEAYFLVFENNKFKPVATQDVKEQELIKCIQDAILNVPDFIKEKFFSAK
jgi:hypothetical protein